MRLPTSDQWRALCDEIADTVNRLRDNGPTLLSEAKSGRIRDSLPTRVPGSEGYGGGRSTVLDEYDTPMPPLSDPVGEIVVNAVGGPVLAAVEKMVGRAATALRTVRQADAALADAVEAAWPSPPPPKADDGKKYCIIHARYEMREEVRSSGRCRWCCDFRATHDQRDPTEEEIRAREDKNIAKELQHRAAKLRPAA